MEGFAGVTGYHWRAAIYFVVLTACLIGALGSYAPLSFSLAFFLIAASQFLFLCPRCGKHIDTKSEQDGAFFYLPGELHDETCPRCRRTRKGVWPGQYFLHREPWDGVRHDDL